MEDLIELLRKLFFGTTRRELDTSSPALEPEIEPAPQTPEERALTFSGIDDTGEAEKVDTRPEISEPSTHIEAALPMKTSLRGKLELISHEAVVLRRYQDIKRVWTIAVGITAAARASINPETFRGDITLRQAIELFDEILPKYEGGVNRALAGREVKQHEYDALVSLAYNVGEGLGRKTIALIREGKIPEAINLWRADPALWTRRDKEVRLARHGNYEARSIPVYEASARGVVNWGSLKRVPIVEVIEMLEEGSV